MERETYQDAVAVVAAESGEIEPAVPRQDLSGARQSGPHQTEPISRSQTGVIRPITDCRVQSKREQRIRELVSLY